jgi:uncharacterized protein YqiB (DUF1249 family)
VSEQDILDMISTLDANKAVVEQPGKKPDWNLHINLFPCKWLKICLKTIFSKSLLTQESNETGL